MIVLKPGDIVQYLNGIRTRTMDDLQNATARATYCKLEVLGERLDRHIMQKALYEEDPRHLELWGTVPMERSKLEARQREMT